MFHTYIIESQVSGIWYYGYTQELEQRLINHNAGDTTSTRGRGPWKYVFVRSFNSKKEAMDFEKHLKRSRNKDFIRRAYHQYFV